MAPKNPQAHQLIDDLVLTVAMEEVKIRETWLTAKIQPKPRWLPKRIWMRILRRLLFIEERNVK
jgi:hypothetical protein